MDTEVLYDDIAIRKWSNHEIELILEQELLEFEMHIDLQDEPPPETSPKAIPMEDHVPPSTCDKIPVIESVEYEVFSERDIEKEVFNFPQDFFDSIPVQTPLEESFNRDPEDIISFSENDLLLSEKNNMDKKDYKDVLHSSSFHSLTKEDSDGRREGGWEEENKVDEDREDENRALNAEHYLNVERLIKQEEKTREARHQAMESRVQERQMKLQMMREVCSMEKCDFESQQLQVQVEECEVSLELDEVEKKLQGIKEGVAVDMIKVFFARQQALQVVHSLLTRSEKLASILTVLSRKYLIQKATVNALTETRKACQGFSELQSCFRSIITTRSYAAQQNKDKQSCLLFFDFSDRLLKATILSGLREAANFRQASTMTIAQFRISSAVNILEQRFSVWKQNVEPFQSFVSQKSTKLAIVSLLSFARTVKEITPSVQILQALFKTLLANHRKQQVDDAEMRVTSQCKVFMNKTRIQYIRQQRQKEKLKQGHERLLENSARVIQRKWRAARDKKAEKQLQASKNNAALAIASYMKSQKNKKKIKETFDLYRAVLKDFDADSDTISSSLLAVSDAHQEVKPIENILQKFFSASYSILSSQEAKQPTKDSTCLVLKSGEDIKQLDVESKERKKHSKKNLSPIDSSSKFERLIHRISQEKKDPLNLLTSELPLASSRSQTQLQPISLAATPLDRHSRPHSRELLYTPSEEANRHGLSKTSDLPRDLVLMHIQANQQIPASIPSALKEPDMIPSNVDGQDASLWADRVGEQVTEKQCLHSNTFVDTPSMLPNNTDDASEMCENALYNKKRTFIRKQRRGNTMQHRRLVVPAWIDPSCQN